MDRCDHIAVAMSGGVDSTAAAYLALKKGFKVTGIHLKMAPEQPEDPELYESCRRMGIELVEHDCSENFYRKVLLASALEYDSGRTPNPCCQCNVELKFAELFRVADLLGIEKVYTGHYVRLEYKDGIYRLKKGADRSKDQSYFLYRLTQKELSRCDFPLGDFTKAEVRKLAEQAGLPCAERKDSQDACFQIAGECCGETLRRICKLEARKGKFIYRGKKVGCHEGIHRYTLGQRQGLNVALGVPAYIKRISALTGEIELTTEPDELMSSSFTVKDIVWQSGIKPDLPVEVRVRYRSPGCACELHETGEGSIMVIPHLPQRAVTPGQAAVFYKDDVVAGGGIIEDV